jgi:membrane-associated phospholipid phosphatase
MWYNLPVNAEVIKFVQSFSNPFLDRLFQYITMMGEEYFFVIALTLIYWCIDKRFGYKIGFAILGSTALNSGIKEIFKVPRPIGEDGIRSLRTETAGGYSFPSGHTRVHQHSGFP